ncbi:MAG: flavodoxin domain-containing protein, partial [Bacillota bacterium]|nr:flavodoxin domain-containing protein [Bacillota bacterium]
MNMKIYSMYFSPTGTTKKVVSEIAKNISENINGKTSVNAINFTLPGFREAPVSFAKGDVVILGVPVYAGRVPNILLKYLN